MGGGVSQNLLQLLQRIGTFLFVTIYVKIGSISASGCKNIARENVRQKQFVMKSC